MREFSLQVDGAQLSFDTDGAVHDTALNTVGSWETVDNKVVFKKAGGAKQSIDVDWAFNANNQLTISQGGKTVFTLVNTPDGLCGYHLEKNVLKVDPDGDLDFVFDLQCLFGLDGEGNLIVSINGKQSVLDGYIEDTKSRFRFRFDDKELPTFPNSLVFSGKWERRTQGAAADEIRLHFVLDDAALEIKQNPLDLPAQVQVDRSRNHLALIYQSKSKGERRLQFQGSFEIKPNFTLAFRIDDVTDGVSRKSMIEIETTFDWDVAEGSLKLKVGRSKSATAQTIEVGGQLKAKLKGGTLTWDFAYKKDTAGGQSVKTIATALSFESDNTSVFIRYTQDGQVKTLDITAKFATAKFTTVGGVKIKNDQQGRSVGAFLGVSW
jgi:hypothetical protein